MAQLSVHDLVVGADDISIKRVCETIAKLLNAVDKADKKACVAAAEGALGALSKMSGREGFAALTPQYLRTNIKLVLNAAFDTIKAHDALIGDEIAKFQGFLGSDLDHAVQKLGARECDAKVMKVFDPKEPKKEEERKRKYAALKHSDDPDMNKILDDTIITKLGVVSTKLDKLDALADKLDETNRLLKQIAGEQASTAARAAALASIAAPVAPLPPSDN